MAPPDAEPDPAAAVDDRDYERLARLRAGIRRYLAWAEECARSHGTTPAQYQLALAVRAWEDPAGPTLSDLADTLQLRHHSVVGLVDRAVESGLVERARDAAQASRVRVHLTPAGAEQLGALTREHLAWLAEHGGEIQAVWRAFDSGE